MHHPAAAFGHPVARGRYHLAGWPDLGARHDTRCPFFKFAAALTGKSGYAAGAITETSDGTHIRLHQPLTVRGGEGARTGADEGEAAGAPSRNTVSMLGLLHWLWEQAGLNQWDHRRAAARMALCQRGPHASCQWLHGERAATRRLPLCPRAVHPGR